MMGGNVSDKGKVLVACPSYAGKEYALDAWIEGFKSFNYPDAYAYMLDNTTGSKAYFDPIVG